MRVLTLASDPAKLPIIPANRLPLVRIVMVLRGLTVSNVAVFPDVDAVPPDSPAGNAWRFCSAIIDNDSCGGLGVVEDSPVAVSSNRGIQEVSS